MAAYAAPYAAPVEDMRFVLERLVGLDELAALPGCEDATPEIVAAVLEEASKLAGQVLAPLNPVGDRQGSVLENGVVRTPDGFREAYAQYRAGGWNAVPFSPEYGGQGLPWAVAFAVQEMWQSSNMAFGLCPLLNQGAVEALEAHGTEQQKALYLPRLISGEWTGTMNLTEPQAGTDVGAVKTRAVPNGDGSWAITGQKIYITYGEHDLAENIVHLVLARTPGAPAGVKGISLFVVPKFLPDGDGRPGARNDLRCQSLEHKLGIHASPTCVMAFGDGGGATGWLVGEENRGLAAMFTMMNNARLSVGLQGVAIAERAYQQARAYAFERQQGRAVGDGSDGGPSPIVRHPDVRRMLLTMKAKIEAARALTYHAAAELDRAKRASDPAERARAQAAVDLLTPVVKAWATDLGCEAASLGIQVHGGMGYVEETGAAQHLRDARIAPIYEGTNGIQANDLVFRKVLRDNGNAAGAMIGAMRDALAELDAAPAADPAVAATVAALRPRLEGGLAGLDSATERLVGTGRSDPAACAAGAAAYLELWGIVAGGWVMARAAVAAAHAIAEAGDAAAPALRGKLLTARFYAEQIVPRAAGLIAPIAEGHATITQLDEALL